MTKIFVTSYALTRGILEMDAEINKNLTLACIRCNGGFPQYAHKGEWFTMRADAVADAERRRAAKIASVEKQLARLKKMELR